MEAFLYIFNSDLAFEDSGAKHFLLVSVLVGTTALVVKVTVLLNG
jgi:hypothetical protein